MVLSAAGDLRDSLKNSRPLSFFVLSQYKQSKEISFFDLEFQSHLAQFPSEHFLRQVFSSLVPPVVSYLPRFLSRRTH
jgi:hypothetical protein